MRDSEQTCYAENADKYLKATLLYGVLDCVNQLVHVISCKQRQTPRCLFICNDDSAVLLITLPSDHADTQ